MSQNYYYLVAGLKEYQMDSQVKGFDALAIRDDISAQISSSDRKYLELLYRRYDIENILSAREGKSRHNLLGNISQENIAELIEHPEKFDTPLSRVLNAYAEATRAQESGETIDPFDSTPQSTIDVELPLSNQLWNTYYDMCAKSKSSFIRKWAEFEQITRNVIAATSARKSGIAPKDVVVGRGEIIELLAKSQAADFGLKEHVEYIDTLIQILDTPNILEREKRLDKMRWDMAEEFTTYDYFNMNRILCYLVKINIIDRWIKLDKAEGERLFRQLSNGLRASDLVDSRSEELTQKK